MFWFNNLNKVDLKPNTTADDLLLFLQNRRDSYATSARIWKVATRAFLILSVLSASIAAVIPGLESNGFSLFQDEKTASIWTILSASLAALLSTLSGTLKCEENFIFNRKHRHDTDQLIVELSKQDTSLIDVQDKLKLIMEERGTRE